MANDAVARTIARNRELRSVREFIHAVKSTSLPKSLSELIHSPSPVRSAPGFGAVPGYPTRHKKKRTGKGHGAIKGVHLIYTKSRFCTTYAVCLRRAITARSTQNVSPSRKPCMSCRDELRS